MLLEIKWVSRDRSAPTELERTLKQLVPSAHTVRWAGSEVEQYATALDDELMNPIAFRHTLFASVEL